LEVALQSLVADASSRMRIAVLSDCRLDGEPLSDLAADHLYRICREGVTSAALRGRCTRVDIAIRCDSDTLILKISDDGPAMPAASLGHDEFGVKMMAYLARLLGGALRLTSKFPEGTCVTVTVPMSQVRDKAEAA
jgi:signal transduction histidine kinase